MQCLVEMLRYRERMGSALGKTKVLAPSRHRGVDLLSERFIAFVLWEVKF